MATARKILKLQRPFPMRRGGALPNVEVAYETWGDPQARHDSAVMIFTGLSPSAHAASSTEDPAQGWWEDMIGPSLGGMTVLAYCALFPDETRSVISISAAARSAPFSIALRSLQREMIRRDPAWKEGNYSDEAIPVQGMRLARKLGMITYRSAKEWAQRFGRERANAERK